MKRISAGLRATAFCVYLGSVAAGACEGLTVGDAWVREPPPGATAVAVYMTLTNDGADTLVVDGLSSPAFEHGMLHETVQHDGRVRMQHVAKITLPAGQSVKLAPGALHGMLVQPRGGLPRAGETVIVELRCGQGATRIETPVVRDFR